MLSINKNPSARDLWVFTALLPVFFGALAGARWRAESPREAMALAAVGATLFVISVAFARARKWIYQGWMVATYPIAWTVAHVVLLLVYVAIATPIALVLRALGRDPMHRRLERERASYWIVREPNRDTARYFRQF